jgi:protein-L-isoaspartate(D-aspartate) O-methyltransferase
MEDSYLHKGMRRKLVEVIRKKGISSEPVLAAIGRVPRHVFMDSGFLKFSYQDKAFPIGSGQTISQPYTVAFQTQLLEIKPMEKILEVGTGSGYQTSILLELGARVYTIERQKELYIRSQRVLESLCYNANFFFGDGYAGLPSYGPFDKILVTAGATEIPEKLPPQLKIGGRMVIPVGDEKGQVMTLICRTSEDGYKITEHGDFSFVPLLKGTVN